MSQPCGTYAAYQTHKRHGEDPCDDCRAACAAYMAEYRRANPTKYAHEKRVKNARERALWRLAKMHPDEFKVLARDELRREISA